MLNYLFTVHLLHNLPSSFSNIKKNYCQFYGFIYQDILKKEIGL